MPEFALAGPLSDHKLKQSSFTELVKELDLSVKPKGPPKNTIFGIYGFCDLPILNDNFN